MLSINIIVAIVLIAADQIIKNIIASNVCHNTQSIKVINDFFYIVHWHNTGGAWGIMSDYTWVLSLVTIIASIAVMYLLLCSKSKLLCTSFMLVFSGAIGNLIDRIRLGYVIDYLHFNNIFGYDFPAFNLADVCVVAGCVGLILSMIFINREKLFEEDTVASKFFIDKDDDTDKVKKEDKPE